MSKYTFMNLVLDVLNECHKPLTPEEIWTFAQSRGWDEKLETKGKTPWKTIGRNCMLVFVMVKVFLPSSGKIL